MDEEGANRADLYELAREIGREESLAKRTEGLQLITFTKNTEKGRTDPIGRHPFNSRIVFPDKRRLGGNIKAGETYFCDLEEYRSSDGSMVYYANPVIRVDASYLFDLRSDQVDRITAALTDNAITPLLNQARARIEEQLKTQLKTEFESIVRERDLIKIEAERLHNELKMAVDRERTLKLEVESLTQRLQEPEDETGALKANERATIQGIPSEWHPIESQTMRITSVHRRNSEQLTSPFFHEGHYFVYVSPDRHVLMIRPDSEGNMPAVGGKLTIPGLSVLRPFDDEEYLPAVVDARTGGLLVDITMKSMR